MRVIGKSLQLSAGAARVRGSLARGFSMVETLVALVVLAVGMLGVASLFAISLRSGNGAISRMQAVNLASDIADRIRANRRAGVAYIGAATAADNLCVGAAAVNCTPQQMAANDIYLWRRQLATVFPGGTATATIAYVAGASPTLPSTYTITVTWSEQGQKAGETASTQQYVMQIQAPTN